MKPTPAQQTELVTTKPAEMLVRAPDAAIEPLQILAQAVQKGSDVGTLERLKDLIEWDEKRKAKAKFDSAISAFQIACPVLKRTVQGAKAKFTPLDHVLTQIKPMLQEQAISFRFTTAREAEEVIVTVHISAHGHTEATAVSMPVDKLVTRDGRDIMTAQQCRATAISYGQRYALQCALGIVTAGDDRDGQGPAPKPAGPSKLMPNEASLKDLASELWAVLKPVRGEVKNWDASNQFMWDEAILMDTERAPELSASRFREVIAKAKQKLTTT